MADPFILMVYKFSPLDDSVEHLKFDTAEEMEKYIISRAESGDSCLYYPESALPFKDGWDELAKTSYAVFD